MLSVLWALFVLPPQVLEWSGRGGAADWVVAMYDGLGYRGLVRQLRLAGLDDVYLIFGAAIVPSIVLVWWATRPALRALGWSGRALSWGWLAFAPFVALSYLNHPADAPLHLLWGAEAFVLLALFAWSIVVAIIAPRGAGIPLWVRVLVGGTALFGVGGTLLAGYWPHGTMLGIGALAIALALWRPVPAGERAPAG